MYFNHSFVIKNAKIQISENSDEMMQFKGLTIYESSLKISYGKHTFTLLSNFSIFIYKNQA